MTSMFQKGGLERIEGLGMIEEVRLLNRQNPIGVRRYTCATDSTAPDVFDSQLDQQEEARYEWGVDLPETGRLLVNRLLACILLKFAQFSFFFVRFDRLFRLRV